MATHLLMLIMHLHHHHLMIRQAPYCTVNRQLVVTCVGLGR